jgi:hypothetical protein
MPQLWSLRKDSDASNYKDFAPTEPTPEARKQALVTFLTTLVNIGIRLIDHQAAIMR